jgi:hypothetical protein
MSSGTGSPTLNRWGRPPPLTTNMRKPTARASSGSSWIFPVTTSMANRCHSPTRSYLARLRNYSAPIIAVYVRRSSCRRYRRSAHADARRRRPSRCTHAHAAHSSCRSTTASVCPCRYSVLKSPCPSLRGLDVQPRTRRSARVNAVAEGVWRATAAPRAPSRRASSTTAVSSCAPASAST